MRLVLIFTFLLIGISSHAQEKETVEWLSFDQLDDSLSVQPKKVFVDFYTDWCTYCRKMDKVVFTKPEVVKVLNDDYYSVRMDAESTDSIRFDGQFFINDQVKESRNPVHQLAQILAYRDGEFTPPTMIILDENFNIRKRYFEYLDSKRLIKELRK